MFTRRYSALPSLAVLLAVSGVVIIDAPPPTPVNASPFGRMLVVGEFEDGAFNTPTALLTGSDQATKFGLFGYQYGSKKYQYPCARRSGGAEDWNGNGWLQTAKLPFGGLAFVRVDSSIGQVTLTPRAFVQGTKKAPFQLDAGQTFIFTPNGGGAVTVTFAATAASVTGTGITYPTSFAGGETLPLALDGGSSFDVVFQPGDTNLLAIINRINTVYGQAIASSSGGQLKITSLTKGTGSKVTVTAGTTATALGLAAGTQTGTGDAANIAAVSFAEAKAKIEGASALVAFTTAADGSPRLVSKAGGTGTILIGNGTANAGLGFSQGTSATTAALGADVVLPAGMRCSDGGADATRVVTMQTVRATKGSTAALSVPVRPAVDDGSYAGVSATDIDTLEDKPADLEWSVTNLASLSAALTASQLDSRYLAAIDTTLGISNDVTKKASGIVSARQSNAIRAKLRENALAAAAGGSQGRRAFVCPPNGTGAATALGSAAPGVGATRAEEVATAVGGVLCVLQELIDGGHATDGLCVRHPDTLLAARWSVLTPGYNPGQLPEESALRYSPSLFPGLEAAAQGWDLTTYAAFKAAGICAAFYDAQNGLTFEQGVTSVDPAADPSRVTIARKTLADFIGDSIAAFLLPQAKRQGTVARHEMQREAIEGFVEGLIGDTVERYTLSLVKLAPNLIEWNLAVDPVGSDDTIVINLSVGPNAVKFAQAA